ncbi:sugar phosphate nucleotidyltransferase [Rapidithrix thailandica]|uniref:mannose-1-phosphate guanylyltransferase n=1 Tax=Rapidithrix thailandica TaxID=413964 RepID=A0AAW9SHY6_9BACT
MKNNYVVIMAGGIGSRFWPFSRQNHPKQFQDILGTGKTLIQQTTDRFKEVCSQENIYIVTNDIYYDLVKEQLPFIPDEQILLEPIMRNTAPCIAYACYKIAAKNPNANIVISPADHIILKEGEFTRAVTTVLDETAKNQDILATLGIQPSRPDTGYGYIQVLFNQPMGALSKVKTFTEKPKLELAQAFMESGDFVWNAGIFIWHVQAILKAFKKHLPSIGDLFEKISHHYYTEQEKETIKETYYMCKNISIDYGIMEKAKDEVYVLPCDLGWSDLGTWKSLFELSEKNEHQNVLHGNVLAYDTTNCIIKTPSDRLVVVQGLSNYIVAEKDNVLLICNKDEEQRIKQYLTEAKEKKGKEFS